MTTITIHPCKWNPGSWTRPVASEKEQDAEDYCLSEWKTSRIDRAIVCAAQDVSWAIRPTRVEITVLVRGERPITAAFDSFEESAAAAVYAQPHYNNVHLTAHTGIYFLTATDPVRRAPYRSELGRAYADGMVPALKNSHTWELTDLR